MNEFELIENGGRKTRTLGEYKEIEQIRLERKMELMVRDLNAQLASLPRWLRWLFWKFHADLLDDT